MTTKPFSHTSFVVRRRFTRELLSSHICAAAAYRSAKKFDKKHGIDCFVALRSDLHWSRSKERDAYRSLETGRKVVFGDYDE